MQFEEFRQSRMETGGFTTEDALASLLPLMREAVDAHASGQVAPLEGIAHLQVDGVQIWFEEAQRQPPRWNRAGIEKIEKSAKRQRRRSAVDVVAEWHRTTDVDAGEADIVDLTVADRDAEITKPVYLPGYVAWEHALGHHDPPTDVFSLGMLLASLTCGLDFTDLRDLKTFVAHRKNLFALAPALHPVVARAIVAMTELDRHRRPQDLVALLHALQNYREQDVDFEFDLAQDEHRRQRAGMTRQTAVLRKLRERLFEISRRNRLLHFRPTMQTVNLTEASVPLSFDVRSIRPSELLIWNDRLRREVTSGKPMSLNRYLNFSEALYLPSVLDRIRADARRDQAEFGFAQLRLVLCFLRWANLKEQPAEFFQSPLVLLPVKLQKKKGIRDTHLLEPLSTEAEINPVIRHQFNELYGITLPQSIDLAKSSLDELHDFLTTKAAESEPGVAISKIERPRVALIHEKARRRLDQYRKRARLAGRGVRSYLDLDYSYDPANYHPLGITLFTSKVRPSLTHLSELIEETPRPRQYASPKSTPSVVEKERTFYSLDSGHTDNPYAWEFDLCNVTLANFKYRKMSLVRDYEALLETTPPNPAFESTFSLSPRPLEQLEHSTAPLDDRFDVVPCDPTQAMAITAARTPHSYIIQGPPGTGKSQTITNLIADQVAKGKRVLFVCEKRAAIDVVYARLRQRGLSSLCCLIHDSQSDKREFVMDLKATYEAALNQTLEHTRQNNRRRKQLLKKMQRELDALDAFSTAMTEMPPHAGVPVRTLLDECLQAKNDRPTLSPVAREQLPEFAEWLANEERIRDYQDAVEAIQPDGVLAHHPLRLVSPRLVRTGHPLQQVTEAIAAARIELAHLLNTIGDWHGSHDLCRTLKDAQSVADHARRLQPLAVSHNLALLDSRTPAARTFAKRLKQIKRGRRALERAQQANSGWRQKLSESDVTAALDQARAFESRFLPWLLPAWWRLRAGLQRAYDFRSHVVRPTWTQVLSRLQREYDEANALQTLCRDVADEYHFSKDDVLDLVDSIEQLKSEIPEFSKRMRSVHLRLVESEEAERRIEQGIQCGIRAATIVEALARISDSALDDMPLEELDDLTRDVSDHLDALPDYVRCLEETAHMPDAVQTAIRTMPWPVSALRAAVADQGLQTVYRSERLLKQFNSRTRNQHARRLQTLYDAWLESNADEVRRRARIRFLDNVKVASLPAAQLTAEQKEFKKRYGRGRRELEHEFGKSMRYKPIRDLVAGESGDVVRDLKPVWLMSPLSVSDTLPLDTRSFDIVVFDEASQITLEEAVPPLFRAEQTIVVGDEMQLPPTNFFSAKRTDEDLELMVEEEGELVQYDLDGDSLLNHAARNLASTMLGWHYRSRSEALISFSNWAFYDGDLLTVPDEQRAGRQRSPIVAATAEDGETAAAELVERPVSFHFMEHGVYDKRKNRMEADYIAYLTRALLNDEKKLSIGIVAFSEAQQSEIEDALERLAQHDDAFRDRLESELEREEDGQFIGLLVKNLENIQGDERDVIILSVCYGHPPNGKMRMNFGPINKSGGEKRLNVAFSRAKHHMAVISSIHSNDITNDYNDGANCLKNYLRYAEAVSNGDADAARRVLHGMTLHAPSEREESADVSAPAVDQIAEQLRERGYWVDRAIGQSQFQCDLGVRMQDEDAYRLGILVDGDSYYRQLDILERDVMRPRLLQAFGWRIAFVLSKDWYEKPDEILDTLVEAIERETEGAGQGEADLAAESIADIDDLDAYFDDDESQTDTSMPVENAESSPSDVASADAEAIAPDSGNDTSTASGEVTTRRFEFVGGKSKKFWEITVAANQYTVRWGRIGSHGQSQTRGFTDAAEAKRDADRLIRSKLKKGYREVP